MRGKKLEASGETTETDGDVHDLDYGDGEMGMHTRQILSNCIC